MAQAEALARTLSTSAGTQEDHRRLAQVQFWTGRIHYYRNDYRAATESLEHARGLARASGEHRLALLCLSTLGRVLGLQGQFGRAVALLSQAAGPLESAQDDWEWVASAGNLAIARAASGDYPAGLAEQQRILARVRAIGDLRRRTISLYHLAILHLFGGNPAPAWEAAQTCVCTAEESGDPINIYIGLGFRAWAESRLGQPEAAAETLARGRSIALRFGGQLGYSDWFAAAEAELALNAGRPEEARDLAQQAVTRSQAVGGLFAEGLAHRVWGQALAALGHGPEVVGEPLISSLSCFEEGEARLEAARTRVIWALVRRDSVEHKTARDHLAEAAAQFEVSGPVTELQAARRLFDELSVSHVCPEAARKQSPTHPAAPARLTAREREILCRIASGRTNQEIADELVLSVRTVEHHIANLYGKIGVRGRVDATAYALRHQLI